MTNEKVYDEVESEVCIDFLVISLETRPLAALYPPAPHPFFYAFSEGKSRGCKKQNYPRNPTNF